ESYVGYVERLFQTEHPDDVAGLVMVESAHPRQWEAIPDAADLLAAARQKLHAAVWLSRLGVLRWMISDRGLDLPADVRPAFVAFQSHTATIQAVLAEFDGVSRSASRVLDTPAL